MQNTQDKTVSNCFISWRPVDAYLVSHGLFQPNCTSPPFFFPGIPTAQIHSIIERHMHFDPGKKPEQRLLFSMWPKASKWTEDPPYPVSIWSLNVWQQFAHDDLVLQLWRATVHKNDTYEGLSRFCIPSTWFWSRFPGTNTYSCKHGLPANIIFSSSMKLLMFRTVPLIILIRYHTVDGWNLAPPGMYETL